MVRIVQGAFNAGILGEGMYARDDTEKFQKGLRDSVNFVIRPQGGIENRAGTEAVSRNGVVTSGPFPWLIPFSFGTEQTYQIEFDVGVFRVISNGAYVVDTDLPTNTPTLLTAQNPARLTLAAGGAGYSVGDLIYVRDPNGSSKLHEAVLRVDAKSGNNLTVSVNRQTLDGTTGDWGAFGAGATVQTIFAGTHGYDLADLPLLWYAQDADTMYLTHEKYPVRKLLRNSNTDWVIVDATFGTTLSPPTGQAIDTTNTRIGPDANLAYLTTYRYRISAVGGDPQTESIPTPGVFVDNDLNYRGSRNAILWDAHPDADYYIVYRSLDGVAGALERIGSTTGTTFLDNNLASDPTKGPRVAYTPFNAPGKYPAVCMFYEQRLMFGRTLNDPQLVEASRVDEFENFMRTFPSLPDDAFRFRIRASDVNAINAFVPSESFVIFTSGGEWEIAGQGDGDYVRPDQRKLAPRSRYGSSRVRPIHTGTVVVYVEPNGRVVRDYNPGQFEAVPGDLTVLVPELFEDRRIVSWAFVATPESVIWVALDDGTLLSMTYVPEHDVWGWMRHQLGGDNPRVRCLSVTREATRDRLYAVVTRFDGVNDVTATERLSVRVDTDVRKGHFLDNGSKFVYPTERAGAQGLLHLRGQTVTVLIDGDVVADRVVDSTGAVDFGEQTGRYASIGLPYEALAQTLDVRFDVRGMGSTEGRFKSATEIAIRMKRSRAVEAGTVQNNLAALKEWTPGLIGSPIPLRTHTALINAGGDWMRDATVYLRQRYPLPATILSVGPDWELGG